MSIKKSPRGKALLAIAFASGVLNSQLPAQSEYKSNSTYLTVQQIMDNTVVGPETRAYYLLKLANAYITDGDRADLESQLRSIKIDPIKMVHRGKSVIDRQVTIWTDQFCSPQNSKKNLADINSERKYELKTVKKENFKLADIAIKKALVQLDKASEKFAQMNMYFIASQLYQGMGNADGVRMCDEVLEHAFEAAETTSPVDEKQIYADTSVLNLMASCLIAVSISDLPEGNPVEPSTNIKDFTDEDFRKSEKLKLRAIAMLDRLNAESDLRRKGHRDLCLWYKQLGKPDKANSEKLILFELVGFKDDSILYPKPAACGQVAWWQKKDSGLFNAECGMG